MSPWKIKFGPRTGIVLFVLQLACSGCSIFFPDASAPKSAHYTVTPPAEPWKPIAVGESADSVDALKADMAYEDTRTGAIISLNSLCRKYTNSTLEELSHDLVLGIKDKSVVSEHEFELAGSPAKDTTIRGDVENSKVEIRTIVLKKNYCTYDFIFVASPERVKRSEQYFNDFVKSFKVE